MSSLINAHNKKQSKVKNVVDCRCDCWKQEAGVSYIICKKLRGEANSSY